MPELPEVETVKRIIEPQILNRKITDVVINKPQIIMYPDLENFYLGIKGKEIKKMERRGKFLSIYLNNGDKIILHLRMTGQLLVTPENYPEEKHTHLIFKLDDCNEIRFIDTRRFGRFWMIGSSEEDIYSGINNLGLEPFDEEFNGDYLKSKLEKRKKTIKEMLLDQSIVTGIGNIYGDEILFAAGIKPIRICSSLSNKEWDKIAFTIKDVLNKAINYNSITPEDYLKGKGREYRSNQFFKVYGHGGETCSQCGEVLIRIILSGRSSVYCPKCQK